MAEQGSARRINESSTAEAICAELKTAPAPTHSNKLPGWVHYLLQDAKVNSPKIKCFLFLFRLASFFENRKRSPVHRALYYLTNAFYCLFADLFVGGAELPAGTPVGKNLTIHHGYGMVIGKGACLKDNVVLRQGVTIGNFVDRHGRVIGEPIIESGVEFGAGACALGKLTIGEGALVAANCVVFRDVPAWGRVYPVRCVTDNVAHASERAVAT